MVDSPATLLPASVSSEDAPQATVQSVAFHTLGCKTNQLETSAIANEFRHHGWSVVPFEEAASLYVINTCTVTEKSDQESRRIIRRAKLSNPNGRVAVTGCYAQVSPDELARQDGVNYVIGNNFKDQIFNIIQNTPVQEKPFVKVTEIDKSRIVVGASASGIGRTRASLKIQDGCDYKCTYCIIWEARGPSRSLPIADLQVQLQELLREGYKEVVLTGINVGQYEDNGHDFADLLSHLIQLPGDFRLRLTSLDPLEVSDKLIQVIADSKGKIAPHIHLSAQSAEDVVLKRMARRHHVDEFIHVCETIHRLMPHACIGSDIIVGFPGETEERFQSTYDVLASVPIHYFHVFSYSKRKGTPAAEFPDQVPEREKKDRAHKLISLSEVKSKLYRQQFMGNDALQPYLSVIVEESLEKGMSENYVKVTLDANGHNLSPNDLVAVQLTEIATDETFGRVTHILSKSLPAEATCPV